MITKRDTFSADAATVKTAIPEVVSSGLVVGKGRPADQVAFEESVLNYFVAAADLLGAPKSIAAIYGICFASPEPLGFMEIDGRLNISSGSISQGLRVLRESGALRVSTLPPENRDRFEPDLELRKVILHFIEKRMARQLETGGGALMAIARRVPAGNGAEQILEARISSLKAWHDKARQALPLVKAFMKLT